jgi:hypothetical protein
MVTRQRASPAGNKALEREIQIHMERVDNDLKFIPLGRLRDGVVLELAAMSDYQLSRERAILLNEMHPALPSTTVPSAASETQNIRSVGVRRTTQTTYAFRVTSGGPDPHFIARCGLVPGVQLSISLVVRPESGYVFLACYCIGKPPFIDPPGVINCYHVRCVGTQAGDDADSLARQLIAEEWSAFGQESRGPHEPSIGPLNPLIVSEEKELPNGHGKLTHDYLNGSLSVQIDVRRVLAGDRSLQEEAHRLLEEALTVVPRVRGRRRLTDPAAVRELYQVLLASCQTLLGNVARWPPARRVSTAFTLLRAVLGLSEEQVSKLAPLLLQGRRRPTPSGLAVRMLAELTGLSPRQVYSLVVK